MRVLGSVGVLLLGSLWLLADDPVFSGPQAGEHLPAFQTMVTLGEGAGERRDLVSLAGEHPIVIIFVHELTRPSIGLTRLIMNYAEKRAAEGLHSAVVFLSDDVSQMEARIKKARHALPEHVPIGVSVDGEEGPGAYGLNRKVTLTVIVAKAGSVTENFALVQPSIAADAERIGGAIAAALGDDSKPTLAEMGLSDREKMGRGMSDQRFRAVLAPLLKQPSSADEVQAAAKRVENLAARNPEFRARVGTVARRIIAAERLSSYGTKQAQEYLQKWAREYTQRGDDKDVERASQKAETEEASESTSTPAESS